MAGRVPPQGVSPLQGVSHCRGLSKGQGDVTWLGVCMAFLKKQQLRGDPKSVPSLGLQVHARGFHTQLDQGPETP